MRSNTSVGHNSTSDQIQGVNSSSAGLIKATVGAAVVAAAILTFIWLPAEHGVDPTGVGHVLGLTEMGHIKEQLHKEADADAAAALAAGSVQPDSTDMLALNEKLDSIQAQLTAIAATVGASTRDISTQPAAQSTSVTQLETGSVTESDSPGAGVSVAGWTDEQDYTLTPGQGLEVKLVMDKGAVADYEWSANGAVVNHDTHGDGNDNDESISYKQGRSVPEQAGQLTAAFTGYHGWFWRNRTDDDVVITLRTRGDYKGIVLP